MGVDIAQLDQIDSVIEILKWVVSVLFLAIGVLATVISKLWFSLDKRTEQFTRIMSVAVTALKDLGVDHDRQ